MQITAAVVIVYPRRQQHAAAAEYAGSLAEVSATSPQRAALTIDCKGSAFTKHKTSPARLAQLLQPHWHFVLACSQ